MQGMNTTPGAVAHAGPEQLREMSSRPLTSPTRELPGLFDDLDAAIGSLHEVISELELRLHPITRHEDSPGMTSATDPRTTEMGARAQALLDSTRNAQQRIREILGALEI